MKLISWNVNGLRACMTKGFNDFLAAEDPDVICLQETKMQREQADFDFAGYTEFWNSAEKKGYAGTAIFTKTEPLNVTYGIGDEQFDCEGRVICAEFPEFYLVTVCTRRTLKKSLCALIFAWRLRISSARISKGCTKRSRLLCAVT